MHHASHTMPAQGRRDLKGMALVHTVMLCLSTKLRSSDTARNQALEELCCQDRK